MTHKLRALTAIAATAVLAVASNISETTPSTPSPTPSTADIGAYRTAIGSGDRLEVGDVATSTMNEPEPIGVQVRRPGRAEGELFLTAQDPQRPHPVGPQITDDRGRPLWFREIPPGHFAADFRVQEYRGEKVLTWWEGQATGAGLGTGIGYIADENYEIIATVQTPDPGQVMDLHEFRLTDDGTALVISYQPKPYDLSEVGGPKDGTVVDSVVQEIDIATGRKLMNWSSLEHVPLGDSDVQPMQSPDASRPFDYLHVNAVGIDTDGNLLISANAASTVSKVDRKTGDIIWRLGGRNSDFRLGVGARFMWQHDVQAVGNNTYRVFDNATKALTGYESRVAWIKVDTARGRAELVRQQVHPDLMSSSHEGGSQGLDNGNTLVSWGKSTPGRVSEFSRDGRLLYDATMPANDSSYRAYRMGWEGKPLTKPQLLLDDAASGTVHANWNGATDVAAGGCTVDVPWMGRRLRDVRNRFALPAHVRAPHLEAGPSTAHHRTSAAGSAVASHTSETFSPAVTWSSVAQLRACTRLPLVLKGVLSPQDAMRAAECGADAVVVSNHGGRQLDGAVPSIEALPEVVSAVAGRCDVLLDSGVRGGTDVLRALALGACGVLLGRPVLWGLAAGGEAGVSRVLELLADELRDALGLAGCPDVGEAGRLRTVVRELRAP